MTDNIISGIPLLIKWFSVNTHLIPSFVLFVLGLILLIVAPIKYHIRTRTVVIINPLKAFREYDKFERAFLIIGAAFLFIGLLSDIIIARTVGYFYFKDGIPTLLSK